MSSETNSEQRGYKLILIGVILLATLSSAIKDFGRLEEFTGSLRELACSWLDNSLMTVSARAVSPGPASCPGRSVDLVDSADQFRWTGHIASGKAVEVKGINGDISASDFPLTLLGSFGRKHLEGTIGNGGRKLNLKTLNGSINLRRTN